MSKIHNEYSPINPVGLVQETEQNDRLINGILPARRTINIRGLWESGDVYSESGAPVPIISEGMGYHTVTITRSDGCAWNTIITQHKTYYNGENGHPLSPFASGNTFPAGYYHLHIDNVTDGNNPNAPDDPRKGRARLGFCRSQTFTGLLKVEDTFINSVAREGQYESLEELNENLKSNEKGPTTSQKFSNIYGIYPERNTSYDEIIYVNAPWASIIFFSNYTYGNVSSTYKATFSGITLDYIPWLNYDSKQIYWTPSPSQNNIVKVKIPQPAPAINSTWLPVRPLASPSNPDAVVDTASNISLKGFATKETVERWIESSDFADYYEMLTSNWWLSTKEVAEDNGEFSFNRYLDTEDFPYDVLFECDVDIPVKTANGQRYIEFDSDIGLDEQDIFAIYERKKYNYNFYYSNSDNIYATKSVYYGDSVGNPTQEDAGNNQLPSVVGTTYRLTSSTSGGVTTWTATQAAPSQGDGYTYASTKTAISSSNPWKRRGTNTIENMPQHTALPNDIYEYEMNMATTIPVICVVDGEIQTSTSGYNASENYFCDFGGMYGNSDFRSIEPGQAFNCDLSSYKIFRKQNGITLSIPGRDTSFMNQIGGWFTNSNCVDGWNNSNTVWNQSEPLILYQKTTEVRTLEFDIDFGDDYTFTQSLTVSGNYTPVSYTYRATGSQTNLTFSLNPGTDLSGLPKAYDNIIAAPQGTVFKINNSKLSYYHVDANSDVIERALGWKSGNSTIITVGTTSATTNYIISGNYVLVPDMKSIPKPKIYINSANGFTIKSKSSGVVPANTAITSTAQDFTVGGNVYRARISATNTYEFICLSATATNEGTAGSYSLSWTDVEDNSENENFGGYTKDGASFNINNNISLKLNESATLTMLTTKQLTISVNNLNFFRKNNSASNPVHSETNYTINIYMDGKSSPVTKTYTSTSDTSNIVTVGSKITNVTATENRNNGVKPNLANFRGLSTDSNGQNMVTINNNNPYTLTSDTTLYAQWEKYSYNVSVTYNYRGSSGRVMSNTALTYDPINSNINSSFGIRSAIESGYNQMYFQIECKDRNGNSITIKTNTATGDYPSKIWNSIIEDSSTIVHYGIGSTPDGNTTTTVNNSSQLTTYDEIRRKATTYGTISTNTTIYSYISVKASDLYDAIYNYDSNTGMELGSNGKKLYHVNSDGTKTQVLSNGSTMFDIKADDTTGYYMKFVIE